MIHSSYTQINGWEEMFNADGKLDIFENFRIDRNLPKFEEEAMMANNNSAFSPAISWGSSNITVTTNPPPERWWTKLWRGAKKKLEPKPVSVQEFFRSVKNNAIELDMVDRRAAGYETAIASAQKCGQTALVEQLQKAVTAVRAETQLYAIGLRSYLDESKLIEFVHKTERGLRLDWIANFVRFIPKHVIVQKSEADDRGIFDNYVVLHFDPNKTGFSQTNAEKKAEEEKRKDPILFGVIDGRRRLYFVGDWVDDICNLTFDQVADSIGKDSVGEIKPNSF